MASDRAEQEIAIARREATRTLHERKARAATDEAVMLPLITQALGRHPGPGEVPISSTLLQKLVGRWRITEALRDAAGKVAARTGLEPVEAAKLSECHELLAEIVG